MKLLIITQALDLDDPTLSVYHSLVSELAGRAEQATVICLKKGRNTLPPSVNVLSLGKEEGKSRATYIARLFRYAWTERTSYDAVFVHMNQEYILLAGPLWRVLGKKIYLWRNHYAGSFLTNIAVGLCTKVFYTSSHSYTARFARAVRMPVGVATDTHFPMANIIRTPRSILSLGRIAPSKNIHVLLEALGILKKQHILFTASIYGDALPKDVAYQHTLKIRADELGLSELVAFKSGVPNQETPPIYNAHMIFVNISPQGMFDKTLLEAAACGCVLVTSNVDAAAYLDSSLIIERMDAEHIAEKLHYALGLEDDVSDILEQEKAFVEHHSLRNLGSKLIAEMS